MDFGVCASDFPRDWKSQKQDESVDLGAYVRDDSLKTDFEVHAHPNPRSAEVSPGDGSLPWFDNDRLRPEPPHPILDVRLRGLDLHGSSPVSSAFEGSLPEAAT